jgi:hypothetical protein
LIKSLPANDRVPIVMESEVVGIVAIIRTDHGIVDPNSRSGDPPGVQMVIGIATGRRRTNDV